MRLNLFNRDFDSTIVELQQYYLSLTKSREDTIAKKREYSENLDSYNKNKEYFSKSIAGKSILGNIEDKFTQYQNNFLKFVKEQEVIQNKIQKGINKIYKSNPSLKYLSEYNQILSEDKFHEILVTLTKGYKNGLVEREKVLDLKKFKRVDFEKGSAYVKDNRTHYGDCIVINELNEVLLLKRNKIDDFEPAKYCLPGGHVEDGEDFEYAALRELEEETGIKSSQAFPSGDYVDNKIVIHYFTVKVKKDECNIFLEEREHQQYEWVPLSKINEYPLLKNLKDNFEEVILIPSNILNPVLPPNIFSYYNNGNFVKSEDIESLFEANNLYNDFKKGKSPDSFENHIKENKLDIQTYSIYNLSPEPVYGVKFNDNIEKSLSHKYFKREGVSGNYKYTYPEDLKETDKIERNIDDPYTYKGTEVLVNKFGIRDKSELSKKERIVVGSTENKISKMDFSSSGFKKLHNELFGDLYEWADKTRTVNLSNGNAIFAPMRFLEEGLNTEFQKIQSNINNKDKFSDEQWINKAGDHFGEIIFIHPFREGNGRTTRKFINLFLKEKGLNLNWDEVNKDEYYKASLLAINKADNSLIKELFLKHIIK